MRGLILLGGMVLIQPQDSFAQAPPATPPSAEVIAAQAQIAQSPNSATAYINLALAENSANHSDEAIAAASHALAIPYTDATGAADSRPVAYFQLAMAYFKKDDSTNALSQLDAGLSRYPGSPYLSDLKGIVLIAGGQYSRASEVLLPAFVSAMDTTDPKAFSGWGYVWNGVDAGLGWNLALSRYYAGQYPQALESARQLVALHDLGNVCVNPELDPGTKKQCTEMAEHSKEINRIDGHDVSSLPNSGFAVKRLLKGPVGSVAEIYQGSKNHRLQIVRQGVPLTKDDAGDFGLLALTLHANGDLEQALAMAQKAIGLDPGNFWAELSYGLVLEDTNRLDEALKALEIPTTDPPGYSLKSLRRIHLAVLYARKGDMAKAQELYLAAAFDPNCLPVAKEKEAFMALVQPMVDAHLAKAKQLDAQGKYAESLPEYAQALSFAANEQEATTLRAAMFAASGKMPTPPEMPDEARRHVVRGELLLNQGMMERALVEFNEALRIAPYMPKLYYNTALIYGELKQYDQAIRQMHLYLTAAPEAPDAQTAQDQITKWELQQEMSGKG
jgi:tetratricopeptide (TPR) repeat protein